MFFRGGEIAGRTDRFSSVNSVVPCYRVGWRKKNETNHRSRPEGEDYACLKFAVIPSTRALAVVRHVTRFELCNSRLSSPFWTTIVELPNITHTYIYPIFFVSDPRHIP